VQLEPLWNKPLVPGAGIEPARLAAGDFELAIYGVRIGKGGEVEGELIQVKEFTNQMLSVF